MRSVGPRSGEDLHVMQFMNDVWIDSYTMRHITVWVPG